MKTNEIYDLINNKVLSQLENGIIPWNKPWEGGMPVNLITNKEYRGINWLLLEMERVNKGYKSNIWLTFKQANSKKGMVKKGEKSTQIVYWNFIEVDNEKNDDTKKIPFLKVYNVFNIEQTTLEVPTKSEEIEVPYSVEFFTESLIKPETVFGGGVASYSYSQDLINMPQIDNFKSIDSFYATYFHEIIHATAHSSRLDRKSEGSYSYNREELVAEIGAILLGNIVGINVDVDNSAAYIARWMNAIKEDKNLLMNSFSKAQKAVDFVTRNLVMNLVENFEEIEA